MKVEGGGGELEIAQGEGGEKGRGGKGGFVCKDLMTKDAGPKEKEGAQRSATCRSLVAKEEKKQLGTLEGGTATASS